MKSRLYYLFLLCAAGFFITGCSDDNQENVSPNPIRPGEAIQFSVGEVKSRTAYDEMVDGWWTLNWNIGDQIGIYTESELVEKQGGGDKKAGYEITDSIPDNHEHHGLIEPMESPLIWSLNLKDDQRSESCTFYGAYPLERISSYPDPNSSDKLFTMKYVTDQTVRVTSMEQGVYQTTPDMKNAYMIAKNTIQPDGDHVLLDFDPIMTTLDITVTAGKYEVATGIIDPVTITGVSVIIPEGLEKGAIVYNTAGMEEDGNVDPGAKGNLYNKMTGEDHSESIFVNFDNEIETIEINDIQEHRRYVELHEGESVKLMAFIPPVTIPVGKCAKVKVHTAGGFSFYQNLKTNEGGKLSPHTRISIQLPDISPYMPHTNEWMSMLDDNMFVMQMSIPGVVCSEDESITTIENWLNMGVRGFDINHLSDGKHNFHNILREDVIDLFDSFLKQHPDEFIIIWFDDNKFVSHMEECDNFANTIQPTKEQKIKDVRGKVVTYTKGNNYFFQMGDSQMDWNRYFRHVTITGVDNFMITTEEGYEDYDRFNNVGNIAQFIDNSGLNSAIYNKIATTTGDKIYTGIVTLPYSENSPVNDKSVCGDLLLQAIIDCNFRYLHAR
ncbi:MAG: hypothetical protein H9802_04165 [Candidatus Phocaeicola faecipullorum]|nr:hypothetical protein [Candidatus Phocaeicola faecipullorum]